MPVRRRAARRGRPAPAGLDRAAGRPRRRADAARRRGRRRRGRLPRRRAARTSRRAALAAFRARHRLGRPAAHADDPQAAPDRRRHGRRLGRRRGRAAARRAPTAAIPIPDELADAARRRRAGAAAARALADDRRRRVRRAAAAATSRRWWSSRSTRRSPPPPSTARSTPSGRPRSGAELIAAAGAHPRRRDALRQRPRAGRAPRCARRSTRHSKRSAGRASTTRWSPARARPCSAFTDDPDARAAAPARGAATPRAVRAHEVDLARRGGRARGLADRPPPQAGALVPDRRGRGDRVAVLVGFGVIHLPNFEKLLEDAGNTLGPWTYLVVGGLAFAETGAFLGFIAPGETAVIVGGLVAGQGQISLIGLIAVVWSCAVAGDMTSYYLGRRLGRQWLLEHGARLKITEERLDQVERFLEKRRRRDDHRRPLPRLRAAAEPVHRRGQPDAVQALRALRHPRRRRLVDHVLRAGLRVLALDRQAHDLRLARPVRVRDARGGDRGDRRPRPAAPGRGGAREGPRMARRAQRPSLLARRGPPRPADLAGRRARHPPGRARVRDADRAARRRRLRVLRLRHLRPGGDDQPLGVRRGRSAAHDAGGRHREGRHLPRLLVLHRRAGPAHRAADQARPGGADRRLGRHVGRRPHRQGRLRPPAPARRAGGDHELLLSVRARRLRDRAGRPARSCSGASGSASP